MNPSLLVMKFGGTNMAGSAAIRHSASLAARSLEGGVKVIVVVSAMAGVTNQLLSLADAAQVAVGEYQHHTDGDGGDGPAADLPVR